MDLEIALTCVLIALARVADVTLGTLRTVYVIRGNRRAACSLGFLEVLVWVFAVGAVIHNLQNPLFAVSFALGFAAGNFLGMTIERWIAEGDQVIRAFTRSGDAVADVLRGEGHRVTSFLGKGRDGPVTLLFIKTRRKDTPRVTRKIREVDREAFYLIDDVRESSTAGLELHYPSHWRGLSKKK